MDASTERSIPVRLYLRPPVEGWHSIERVFKTVVDNLPSDICAELVTPTRPSRGVRGRVRALLEVRTRAPGVHHVTGDVHFLVFALPWRRTVLTIHDLVRLRELNGLRRWLYRLLWFSIPLRLAASVTAISEQTSNELLEEFPYVASKRHVIPNPLPASLSPANRPRRPDRVPVILHVGTTENKNLGLSISVAERIGAHLSILGRLNDVQRSALERSGITFRAQHEVPDDALADVYRSADVLLFASFAEGFGMPIIEAQACGVPVVTSDREPMRSVAGRAALLVDPSDVDAAEPAVRRLLEDDGLRGDLREAGFTNVERYSARFVAERYAEVYRAVLGPTRVGR